MSEPEAIADLLERCRAGDPEAAHQLFAAYARRLTGVADQHLSRKLAGREDGEDVVQSVFRTFFRRAAAGEFRIARVDKGDRHEWHCLTIDKQYVSLFSIS